MDGYLTRRELAATLGRDVATIDRWRKAGTGPPATLVGRAIVYSESSFRAWLAAQEESEQVRMDRYWHPSNHGGVA
jgi:predicted DNA-binding transcriptional regulator AlpA